MEKKSLAVLTENDLDRNYMCQILQQIFSPYLDIVPVTPATAHTLRVMPTAVLVNITSLAYADKYFPHSQIIFAKRFLNSDCLQKLIKLPEGTAVLVANKPRRIAEDLVENLQLLGIHHLKYIPYWPGCDIDTTPYDIVVYAGFRSYCPENKKVYIDLGYRNITASTLAEIVKVYDLPSEFLDQFQIPTMKRLVDELYHGQNTYLQNSFLEAELHHTLSMTNTALFHLDEELRVVRMNEAAGKLCPEGRADAMGRSLSACWPELPCAQQLLSAGQEEEQFLYLKKKPYILRLHFETIHSRRHCFLTFTPVTGAQSISEKMFLRSKKNPFPAKYRFQDIRGHSPALQKAVRLAQYYAGTDENILILGESGTGKELFAQSIHNASDRGGNPFIAVNCAAISSTLIESELFGYEEGAFTGARKGGKPGLFESADTGTIFLDEIGDVSLTVQSRLLRVLEEREIMPVGSTKIIPINVRVLCATNKDLKEMVRQGEFQEALYYRLKILTLNIPPLRERKGDIPELLRYMVEGMALPPQLETQVLRYSWPGNVRELRAFASNLNLFSKQDIPEDSRASLLDELVGSFFSGGADTPPGASGSPPLTQEDLLLLRGVRELTGSGRTAGRGSLLCLPEVAVSGLTEGRMKARLHALSEGGYLSIGRTRQGIRLTSTGEAALAAQT